MLHFLGDLLSPAGSRAKLTILVYHRALTAPDLILSEETDAATFTAHMRLLASEFTVLPLGEACARLARGALPARAACITFDDGYADNETTALPVLRSFGLCATFFIAVGYTGGAVMFNDAVIHAVRHAAEGSYDLSACGLGVQVLSDAARRRAAVDALIAKLKYRAPSERERLTAVLADTLRVAPPRNLMLSPTQIRNLHAAGMEIGGHTVSHPILATLDERAAWTEISAGKGLLEDIIGAPVELFAYPNGKPGVDYTARDILLVKQAGYAAAVSTLRGAAVAGADPFQLPRFGPWDRSPLRLGVRLLWNCTQSSTPRVPAITAAC